MMKYPPRWQSPPKQRPCGRAVRRRRRPKSQPGPRSRRRPPRPPGRSLRPPRPRSLPARARRRPRRRSEEELMGREVIVTRRAAMLPVSFFRRPTDVVARDLIGRVLIAGSGRTRTVGRIVETEAYLGHRDPASHGFAKRRHSCNETLYSAAGTWYVYLSYGMHWCANLVCERETNAGAVLLRALE